MKMSSISKESGILKLVHPGGFVEIHKNPIIAAEVMERNPRHCVTRPDVFKYPWIVVRPESVLKPGRVFFIVPYHTIHRLLQAHDSQNHSSFKQHQQDFCPRVKLTSEMELWAEDEVTRQNSSCQGQDPTESLLDLTHFHCLMNNHSSIATQNKASNKNEDLHADLFRPKCLAGLDKQYQDKAVKKQLLIKSPVEMKVLLQDSEESPKKQNSVEYWSKAVAHYKNNQKTKKQTPVKSFVEPGEVLLPKYDGGFELNRSQQVIKLKSCLKKNNENNNLAKSRSLRVTFVIPEEEEKKLRFEEFEFPQIETQ